MKVTADLREFEFAEWLRSHPHPRLPVIHLVCRTSGGRLAILREDLKDLPHEVQSSKFGLSLLRDGTSISPTAMDRRSFDERGLYWLVEARRALAELAEFGFGRVADVGWRNWGTRAGALVLRDLGGRRIPSR